jgi:hypothetical protein
MPQRESPFPLHDAPDDALAEYQPLSGMAVISTILGGLSPLVLIDPLAVLLPIAGIALGLAALLRIARNAPALTGRRLAMAGVGLSLLFLVAAPAEWLTYRWQIRREALQLGNAWFAMLRDDQPQMALQLTLDPRERHPLGAALAKRYRETPELRDALAAYVQKPVVRALLALGRRADVHFDSIADESRLSDRDAIDLVYAVSYDEGGQKKAFCVVLHLTRLRLRTAQSKGGWLSGRAVWQVTGAEKVGR